MSRNKIAIVTPLKDEEKNISRLISSVENQTVPIFSWVIVENGSKDKSKDILSKIDSLKNVQHFKVINYTFEDSEYKLGRKYATIISEGLSYLKNDGLYDGIDYFAILDADTFPEPNYYEAVLEEFQQEAKAGIIGSYGKTDDGEVHLDNKNDPCGAAMVFSKQCLEDATYRITPSAASVVKTKARILGYKVKTTFNTHFVSRKMGVNIDQEYYGKSAYYMGIPLYHAIMHFAKALIKGNVKGGFGYIKGYSHSFFSRKERIDDPDIIRFNRFRIVNKLKNRFSK
jgi:glycosyltransferase involved in cell wall biosynthesis